jgi:UDP-N-acetylmuramoyl-tripeptide--D-alanyl-D-alanine ligase
VPQLLDITTRLLRPYEEHNAKKFVKLATQRLKRVAPIVVGITGSYGKTSTKNHLRELLERDGGIVATPKSFNNRAGLSRAINENLVDGTRVFIAEMGTYGPGEIADLCAWCPPSIAIVTAIGPVHLERMKSLETVEAAKFEITSRADIVILNIDDTRLANWPAKLGSKQVITAGSKNEDAFVRVIAGVEWSVIVGGDVVATFAPLSGVQPTNLACAIAASLQLGLTKDQIAQRINTVLPVANRANVVTAPSGVIIIDDTFNANPASASAALETLRTLPIAGRRVVMTPGLIELGKEQWTENVKLATHAAGINAELGIVGRTNALPLLAGAGNEAMRFDVREDAVNWVRANLASGDAVLYLNDLPDHYL